MRKLVVGSVVVAVGIACFASAAWAGRPSFDSSPKSGPAGTVIHASGTQCTDVAGQGVTVALGFDDSTVTSVDTKTVAGGSWSVDLTVPAGTKLGDYEVAAFCNAENNQFTYNANAFTVTAAPATTTTTTTTTVAVQQATTTTTIPPAPVAPAAEPVVAQPTMTG